MIDPAYSGDFQNAYFSQVWNGSAYVRGTGVAGAYPTTIICSKCHNLFVGNKAHTAPKYGGSNAHICDPYSPDEHGAYGYCTSCHIKVPHGWKRPRLLGYTTDPPAYSTRAKGLNAVALSPNAAWADAGDCAATGCSLGSGFGHEPTLLKPAWP
jgi:hypothetical protein